MTSTKWEYPPWETLLDPPSIVYGETGGVLDLSSPQVEGNGAVYVSIPDYPKRNPGDRITLRVARNDGVGGLIRYRYLQDLTAQQLVKVAPLWLLPEGFYGIAYKVASRTGNAAFSEELWVNVINTPPPPAVAGQISLWGTYVPGPVASWVVPEDYVLIYDGGVLMQALETSQSNVVLNVYCTPMGSQNRNLFAVLSSGTDGKSWVCTPSPNPEAATYAFHQGDLVTVELAPGSSARLCLAVAM